MPAQDDDILIHGHGVAILVQSFSVRGHVNDFVVVSRFLIALYRHQWAARSLPFQHHHHKGNRQHLSVSCVVS
jgi:hypothetical protein